MADGWGSPVDPTLPTPPVDTGGWGAPIAEPPKKEEPELPMPGPIDALTAGVRKSITDISQSGETLGGKKPTPSAPEENPAATGFGWRDLLEPSRGLSKLAYQTGASSPAIAGGVLGGFAGSLVEPGLGTAIGGAGGAAVGASLQTIGPAFAQELKKHPQDAEGAWTRAVEGSLASGAASGASWALFPAKVFQGPIKNLAFQAFGIQPGVNVAEKAAQNIITGDPATSGLGEAYTQGVVGTAVPALGHAALRGRFGEPETIDPNPTVAESAAKAQELRIQANQHITNSMLPNTPPDLAKKLQMKADDLNTAADAEVDRHIAPLRADAKINQATQLEQQAQTQNHPLVAQAMKDQAFDLRDSARQDQFIANLPPPLAPKTGLIGRLQQSYLYNIAPELTSQAALKADAVIAGYKSMEAQLRDSLLKRGTDTYRYKWNDVDWNDQKRFISSYEQGIGVPQDLAQRFPWMDQAYHEYKRQSDLDYQNEVAMGSKAHYVEDYFPHRWTDPEKARQVFQQDNMLKSMGPKWFQKARDYELVEFGEANGLELREHNVQDMITGRRLAGADMINRMQMLHDLQKIGIATPLEQAPPHIINPKIVGSPYHWEPVNAPNSEKWLIAPDAQTLWKNGVEAKGLWANETALGDAFRGWMKVKSAWVPIKLSLSLFHPVHVAHINMVNNMSRAIGETFGPGQQGLMRRFAAMPEAMLQSVGDTFFRAAIPGVPFAGKRLMKSWVTPKELQTPQQAADVRIMNEAGVSAQMSEQMRMRAEQGFKDAWSQNRYLAALPHGVKLGLEKSLGAIFEKWIPSLKVAALQRESEALFRRRPDLLNDETNRKVALRALGKQIDNRFGEMFYGSLFWNRTLKDASIGSFLSLGWNLGFAREFGGGFFEPIVRRMIDAPNPSRKLVRDTTNKTTNMFVYAMTAGVINGIMNKSLSGDNPEGMDYIFPRIGGLNPDGSPRRVTNAFYTREVPMAFKNVEERQSVVGGLTQMLYHKMMFSPFVEMGTNRDYFGYQITDENSPMYQRIYQFTKHLIGDQLNPMSVAGAKRALELSGKPHDTKDVFQQLTDRDVYMPLLGFGPAPAYASKSAMDNRIQFLFRKYVAPEAKSFDVSAHSKERSEARTAYMGAVQRGDKDAQLVAARKMAELGITTKEISKLKPGGTTEYMYSRLPALDQAALLKQMSPQEFKVYYPKTNKKIRQSNPEIVELAKKYYTQP